jgi:hypothetical protein
VRRRWTSCLPPDRTSHRQGSGESNAGLLFCWRSNPCAIVPECQETARSPYRTSTGRRWRSFASPAPCGGAMTALQPQPRSVPAAADACASSKPSSAAPNPEASKPNPPGSTRHDRIPKPQPHRPAHADDVIRRPPRSRRSRSPRPAARRFAQPIRVPTFIRPSQTGLPPGPRRKRPAHTARRRSTDRQNLHRPAARRQRLTDPRFPPLGGFRTPAPEPLRPSCKGPASETLV